MSDTPAVATTAELHEFLRTGKWPESAISRGVRPTAVQDEAAPKRHKYNVGPRHLRQLDGYTFDSIAERRRYEVLRAMEQAGEIIGLRVHPSWPLVIQHGHSFVNEDVPVGEYEADFSYRRGGDLAVEDVKGVRTAVYRMKKALMKALHGIEVQEVDP